MSMQKILIIEDEEIMRISLEDSLRADGYEVESYEQGADGIKAFYNNKFSLVISDVRLPDITGLDVLEAIKRVDKTVPVIIMTAF